MKRLLFALLASICLASCSKKESSTIGGDSILTKPTTEITKEAQVKVDTMNGLLIDQSRYYTPEQQKLLNRFDPNMVVKIYHDFKSIRKPGITQAQIDAYIQSKKITLDELKAILQEGDRRGWNK